MQIILFALILGLLVFVHELGHFLAARFSKVGVEEFGFGFPPRIWAKKKGSLTISINAIPFGGFVRLQGEQNDPEHRPESFVNATWPRQILVLAAGVIMNYLLAWVLMSVVYGAGVTVETNGLRAADLAHVRNVQVQATVSSDSPAGKSGVQTGDRIVSVDGQTFSSTQQLIDYTTGKNFPVLHVDFLHQNIQKSIDIAPQTASSNKPHYGLGVDSLGQLRYPWYQAPLTGLTSTASLTAQTVKGFGTLISDLVAHGKVSNDLTGPVGIAVLTGEVSRLGVIAVLQFISVLSISLAVVNFLPLPALDGGRALFIVIGRLRGRPINPRVESIIHATGFYALIALVIAITVRDLNRYDIFSKVTQFFHKS